MTSENDNINEMNTFFKNLNLNPKDFLDCQNEGLDTYKLKVASKAVYGVTLPDELTESTRRKPSPPITLAQLMRVEPTYSFEMPNNPEFKELQHLFRKAQQINIKSRRYTDLYKKVILFICNKDSKFTGVITSYSEILEIVARGNRDIPNGILIKYADILDNLDALTKFALSYLDEYLSLDLDRQTLTDIINSIEVSKEEREGLVDKYIWAFVARGNGEW